MRGAPGRSSRSWRRSALGRRLVTAELTDAANTFVSSQFMPVAYSVYALVGNDDPETCRDAEVGHTWRGTPASAQMEWLGGYDLDGYRTTGARSSSGQHSVQPPDDAAGLGRPASPVRLGAARRASWVEVPAHRHRRLPLSQRSFATGAWAAPTTGSLASLSYAVIRPVPAETAPRATAFRSCHQRCLSNQTPNRLRRQLGQERKQESSQ